MLTPEYLADCTDYLLGIYDELDRAVIADISRRIAKTGGMTPTAKHQLDKVRQSGALIGEITNEVAMTTPYAEAEVARLFSEAGVLGIENDARPLVVAGIETTRTLSPAMLDVMNAALAKTAGDLRNLTMTTAVAAQQSYLDAVNLAYMKVQTGTFSYAEAITAAVKQAAVDGNYVFYGSGHRDRLDVAVRRSVLTGLNQTAGKLTEMYADDMGCEYYETSAHAGARPSHYEWQGQVFKIEGADANYPNFEDSTGYGTGEGLCGWNCRHSFYPFWPGISKPAYDKDTLDWYDAPRFEVDGDMLTDYEMSQLLRSQEREIRANKRELVGYQAAMEATRSDIAKARLKGEFDSTSAKLKQNEARYRDLCKTARRQPNSVRTRVAAINDGHGRVLGYTRSTAQKARYGAARAAKR